MDGMNLDGTAVKPRTASALKPIGSRPSRTREVVEALRAAILHGDLAPGSMHSVAELAEELSVSRTPVREALIELASVGMVQFERNRGFRILKTSVRDIEEIFELRLLLEVPAVRRAVEIMDRHALQDLESSIEDMEAAAEHGDEAGVWECDRRFHRRLLATAGNRRLVSAVDGLRDMVRLLGATTVGRTRTLPTIHAEHEMVIAPIRNHDPDGAAEAMRVHLLNTARLLIEQERGRMGDLLQPILPAAQAKGAVESR